MRKALRNFMILFLSIESLTLLVPGTTVKALPIGVWAGTHLTYGTTDGSPWVVMEPSSAPPLAAWKTYMNFSTIDLTVTKISIPDNLIEFNEVAKFLNGTAKGPFRSGFDINTEVGGGFFFIAASLESHARIYPGNANNTWSLNQTWIDHTHWEGREICVLNYTTANPIENSSSIMAVRNTVIYWDQITGVLLSAFEKAAALDPKTQEYIQGYLLFRLIDNNLGIPMDYSKPTDMMPIYIIVSTAAVIAVVVAVVRLSSTSKKKHKRLKER